MHDYSNSEIFDGHKLGVKDSQLSALMVLYEHNYQRIRKLCPSLPTSERQSFISHVPGALDLHLQVLESSRYTSTVVLSYQRSALQTLAWAPDLRVRVYHDARLAEANSGLLHGIRHEQRGTRSLSDSWRLNRFLYKWLGFCLHLGHGFVDSNFGVSMTQSNIQSE